MPSLAKRATMFPRIDAAQRKALVAARRELERE